VPPTQSIAQASTTPAQHVEDDLSGHDNLVRQSGGPGGALTGTGSTAEDQEMQTGSNDQIVDPELVGVEDDFYYDDVCMDHRLNKVQFPIQFSCRKRLTL
jgi:hypothetical protein